MDSSFDPAVTRVTIVLENPGDWFSWLFIRKDSCRRHNLWQYVDPDTPKSQISQLEEPSEPLISSYQATATSLADLDADDRQSFRWDYERYERKLMEYRKKVQALAEFNLEISRTISRRRIYIIQDCETAHERLIALKKHLAPDVATRPYELSEKYNALKVAPSPSKNVEVWLAEWTRITSMGKSINLPETDGVRPQEDFLVACKALDPEYATTCLRDVYRAENCGTTDSLPTLDDYVAEFTAFLRRNRPRSSGLVTVAADLKIAAPFNEEQDDAGNSKNNSNNRNNSKNLPKCLCGMKHWYSDCFIINREHPKRPINYKPPQAAQKKVDEARKNPQVESKIESALDRWRKRNQKNNTLQIDDGLPPSNYDTYIMSLGNKVDENEIFDNECSSWDSNVTQIDCPNESVGELTTMALEDDHTNLLHTRWIVDPGSNTHVINSESWKGWKRERENTERRTINAGNSRTLITAWGRVEIVARTPRGLRTLLLTHVAFVEGFLTSVLGLARCRNESIHFDSGRDILYKHHPSNVVAQLEYNGGHWLIDAAESRRPKSTDILGHLGSFGASNRPSYAPKPVNLIDRKIAHQIWGHPSKKVIEMIEKNVNGVSITGGNFKDCLCEVCIEARLSKIISRRPAESKATKPFHRIGIDLVYIVPMTDECWNGDRYMLHAIDEFTKWHEITTTRSKSKAVLMWWIKSTIRKIQRIFNADVCVIRSDNERGFGNDLMNLCADLGIIFEPSVRGTPEQNGLAERAGGTITARARAMRIQGNLPKSLANEMYKTAAYILNRTPTEALGWKTPYELVWGRKPLVAHMRPIGCQAYALNQNIKKADKTEYRALVGHLVGYQGTNIFRIWLPTQDDIIVTRDVVFDPLRFYDGTDNYAQNSVIRQTVELLEYPESYREDDISIEELLTKRQRSSDSDLTAVTNEELQLGGEPQNEIDEKDMNDADLSNQFQSQRQLLTPVPSEFGDNSENRSNMDASTISVTPGVQPQPVVENVTSEPVAIPVGYRADSEASSRRINLNPYDTSLIVSGKRNRKKAPNPVYVCSRDFEV